MNRTPGDEIRTDTFSYRLGAFGFLTSEELRNAGYKANNGLRDQRVAIKWVRKHIHEFGGDADNVTVAGMSAGGGMFGDSFMVSSKANHSSIRDLSLKFRRSTLQAGYCNERNVFSEPAVTLRRTRTELPEGDLSFRVVE